MSERETLTLEEHERLERMYQTPLGRKALRILDVLTVRLAEAEAHIGRMGHGEVIDVLTEEWTGFTSLRGDLAWDTAETRRRVRARYHAQDEALKRVKAGLAGMEDMAAVRGRDCLVNLGACIDDLRESLGLEVSP